MDTPALHSSSSVAQRPASISNEAGYATTKSKALDLPSLRLQLFRQQENRIQRYYDALYQNEQSAIGHYAQPLFYIASKKPQFVETQKLQIASHLNARDIAQLAQLQLLFDHLHTLDDLVIAIVTQLPPQRPIGWQLISQNMNLLNLPTLGLANNTADYRPLEASAAATVLQFFGVASYHHERGHFIGHIVGYLFCCYYFAHLGINYAVTPLRESVANHYVYQWLSVPQLVRALQEIDERLKQQIYQLAVYCAQISDYAIDKRIEKMLICEVNSFNKQDLRDELSIQLQDHETEKVSLFQPVKPLK